MYRAFVEGDFFLADHHVPEGTYLMEDVTAASLITLRAGAIYRSVSRHPNSPVASGDNVLIIRPGGFGDLLFLTPIIAELHARGAVVTVCAHPYFHPILDGQPVTCIPYPILESELAQYAAVWWMENSVEDSRDETHIVDIFAARIGIELKDKACRYTVTDDERAWANGQFHRTGHPRVGVQIQASAECRTYPARQLMIVCTILAQNGWEVMLFGAPGSIQIDPKAPYVNLTARRLSIRQSAAVLETCDAVIAPDSALCHLAGALNLPTVALYAAFPWQARTRYHPSVYAMHGVAPCAPCFHHARGEPWPQGMPCNKAKQCVVLGSIPPEHIVERVERLVKR